MSTKNQISKLDEITGDFDSVDIVIEPSESETSIQKRILKRFETMRNFRDRSCPTFLFPNEKLRTEDINTNRSETTFNNNLNFVSWSKLWERCTELYYRKTSKNTISPSLPEGSSSLVFSTVLALTAQFQDASTTGVYTPTAGVNPLMARIAELWQESWEEKTNALKTIKQPWFSDTVIYGTGIVHNSRLTKTRKVKKMLSFDDLVTKFNLENASQEEQITFQKMVEKNPAKYLTEEQIMVDYDDFAIETVALEDFFVDPTAMNLNGLTRDARDCIWREMTSIQSILDIYKNSQDPFLIQKNINLGLLNSKTNFDTVEVKNENESLNADDLVEVVKYYNKYQDQYIILINGVIIRNGPLPYNHKLLPFSVSKCVTLKNSFYGLGFATLLDSLQIKEELYSSIQDYTTLFNANLPSFFTDESGETETKLKESMEENGSGFKAGEFIKLGANDKVERLGQIVDNGNIQARLAEIENKATKISCVNPLLFSQIQANTAVRNNQIMQESSLLGIRMIVNNWAEGYQQSLMQALQIIKQTNLNSFEEASENVLNTQKAHRTYQKIKAEGYKKVDNQESFDLVPNKGTNEIELTPDIIDNFDKIDVRIRIETSSLASKTLQAQELESTLNLVMAIVSNPNLKDNKLVMEMLKQFLDKKNMNSKVLSYFDDEDSVEDLAIAQYQNEQMKQGKYEPPLTGMSQGHLEIHAQEMISLIMQRETMAITLEETQDPNIQFEIDAISKIIRNMQKHLAGDNSSKIDEVTTAITMGGQPPEQMPQQPPEQMPEGQMPEGQMPMEAIAPI